MAEGRSPCCLVKQGSANRAWWPRPRPRLLAQDFLLLQGNCFQPDISSPYAPLLDLLRYSAARQLAAAVTSELAPFARELHQLLPDVVPLPPDRVPMSSSDPEQEKHRRFAALTQFFTGQAMKQPVLLIIEDMHWSDDTSLEFLHYLARRCSAHRSSSC